MQRILFFTMFFMVGFFTGCHQPVEEVPKLKDFRMQGKGVLLTTRFNSFEEFKKEVQIEYSKDKKSWVRLTQNSNNQKITSILKQGIKESEIMKARDGGFLGKVKLGLSSPYFVIHRLDMLKVFLLSRRRHMVFGGGDVAFYDFAEAMMNNIEVNDLTVINEKDFSEKGYINTFNHVTAQALMTIIFSEKLADFMADTHERSNMPELISGNFTAAQLKDIKNGPVDNYVDIINNEWGQELGKMCVKKYKINQETVWTTELLANIMNDFQSYFSWVFQVGFEPFRVTDELIIKFSEKINIVLRGEDLSGVR